MHTTIIISEVSMYNVHRMQMPKYSVYNNAILNLTWMENEALKDKLSVFTMARTV